MAHAFEHFVQAQAGVYDRACVELTAGEKRSHWMWFIFPQLAGLGRSAMAQRYALASLTEAADYLRHPVLGPRLHRATEIVNAVQNRSASQIFGYPDDLKFHSSMTLFAMAAQRSEATDGIYQAALERYFDGRMDEGTIKLLAQ